VNTASPVISRWEGPAHGLEAVLNWRNVALGLAVFFLARVLGILYIMNSVGDTMILGRSRKHLWYNSVLFLVFFLAWTGALLLSKGFAADPVSGEITMEPYKYLHNLIDMPLVLVLFLVGVLLVLFGLARSLFKFARYHSQGIWFCGAGTILTVFSLLLLAGFNHTAFYPSTYDLQSSLTIVNSSSSKYTLTAMSYVSLLVPFVLAYIWYAWRAVNRKKITPEEFETETHVY
jgi:cytochrome d ubiquinol oxidase subunit II